MSRITTNPDTEYVQEIKHKLKENGGYCPCQLVKNKDTKCMCKDFREKIARNEPGYCHCGLWCIEPEEEA